MREARAGTDGQARHHCEDCRKGHSADEGKEDLTSQFPGKFGGRHICSAVSLHVIRSHEAGCAKAKERRHDIKKTDNNHGPDHTGSRRLGIGHCVKANQNMRQTRRAKEKRHPK
jgi:hypothetical protein